MPRRKTSTAATQAGRGPGTNAPAPAPPAPVPPLPGAAPDTPAVRAVWAAVHARPGVTGNELARQTSLGRATVSNALTTLEKIGALTRSPGNTAAADGAAPAGRGRRPDTWRPAVAVESPDAQPDGAASNGTGDRSQPAPDSRGTRRPGRTTRPLPSTRPGKGPLRRGQLESLVLEYVNAHPDEDATPTRVAKALDRSTGAVGNALERFAERGQVRRVSAKPRRYRPLEGATGV